MTKLKTIGFAISDKENERRRCLLPQHASSVKNRNCVLVEEGYGEVLGIPDQEYSSVGYEVTSRKTIFSADIICDPKIGDANYLSLLESQTVFGWVHAVQNRHITDTLIEQKLTAIAWEDMFEGGRHTFWKNNETAGEAAVLHAVLNYGMMPANRNVAILGRGNIARGALKVFNQLGANVVVYDRKTEALFKLEIHCYDIVANCVLWDTSRRDHIISKGDLLKMKTGALLIDISCDRGGGIESCVPTSIASPIYTESSIVHYAVDHTPALLYRNISETLSEVVSNTIDNLATSQLTECLSNAVIATNGVIVDSKILKHQNRCTGTA